MLKKSVISGHRCSVNTFQTNNTEQKDSKTSHFAGKLPSLLLLLSRILKSFQGLFSLNVLTHCTSVRGVETVTQV